MYYDRISLSLLFLVMEKCIEIFNILYNGVFVCDYWFGGKFC